jgi:RNA polymerase sigma factor (sigma-70 family)
MSKKVLADWVAQYTEEMYKWALYKTSAIEIAEDLVQDTFLAAAEKLNTFKGDSSPKTWLFSILNQNY